MPTRRIMRWIIVLFLLAVLPVMTVVMAQGQEPGAPEAPATWNVYESEPNNGSAIADVMAMGDVMGGFIARYGDPEDESCDWDVFRFHMNSNGYVLVDIETKSIGSYLAPDIRLLDSEWSTLTSQFDTYGVNNHTLLFFNLSPGDYYIIVQDVDYKACGPGSIYELSVSRPLLVSAAAANLGTPTVGGVQFRSEDVLAFSDLNNGQERWVMFFDGSDVGVKTLSNVAKDSGDRILITTSGSQTLPGVGPVTPWDIVIFEPESYGENTDGTFRMGLDGSAHQLTTSGEKLDAIDGWSNGYNRCYGYPMSTAGVATVTGGLGTMKQDDEDVFCKVYNGAWQPYDWFFDVNGKFDAPAPEPAPGNVTGLEAEDVFALAYNNNTNEMYLTILGNGNIFGHRVTQKDIFAINYPGYTWGGYAWRGPEHGWNYNIDAFELNGW